MRTSTRLDPSPGGGPPSHPMSFSSTEDALVFLRSLQMDPVNLDRLRHALWEEGDLLDLAKLHDHEILELAAARLVSGRLRVARVHQPRAAVGGGNVAEEEEQESDGGGGAAPVDTPTHWIEVELLDEEDQPVAGEEYRITFANGQVREGRTDTRGLIRYPNLSEGGECQITFTRLDEEAWELI